MNPVRKLEKKYPGTYTTFLKVVGNPRTGRAKTLAAMLLKFEFVQDRQQQALREDQRLHGFVDAPLSQEVRDEYEEASAAFTKLLHHLSEAGFPSNTFPILR